MMLNKGRGILPWLDNITAVVLFVMKAKVPPESFLSLTETALAASLVWLIHPNGSVTTNKSFSLPTTMGSKRIGWRSTFRLRQQRFSMGSSAFPPLARMQFPSPPPRGGDIVRIVEFRAGSKVCSKGKRCVA